MTALDLTELADVVREQPFPVLFATVSGAHVYGFPSRDSDVDLRGVHLLPLERVVGLTTGPDTVTRVDMTNSNAAAEPKSLIIDR